MPLLIWTVPYRGKTNAGEKDIQGKFCDLKFVWGGACMLPKSSQVPTSFGCSVARGGLAVPCVPPRLHGKSLPIIIFPIPCASLVWGSSFIIKRSPERYSTGSMIGETQPILVPVLAHLAVQETVEDGDKKALIGEERRTQNQSSVRRGFWQHCSPCGVTAVLLPSLKAFRIKLF